MPPLAVKVTGVPEQIGPAGIAEIVTVGGDVTVTTIVFCAAGQPPAPVPFTLYVVVPPGLTVMLDVVAAVLHV